MVSRSRLPRTDIRADINDVAAEMIRVNNERAIVDAQVELLKETSKVD